MTYTAAQLATYYTLVNQGVAPDASTTILLNAYATEDTTGALSDAQTLFSALHTTQTMSTTDVAVSMYQFFTGSIPSQAGLQYLVNSTANPTDLNDPYYAGFNQENRYYNFAINLAFGSSGAAAFASAYSSLTLAQTVVDAYETIVGSANVGATNAAAAEAAISASIPYFQAIAASRATGFNQDLATKAIIVGYIMEEAIKADVGTYAKAIDQFNLDVAGGVAVYATNLLTTYVPGGAGYNIGVGGTGTSIGGTPGSTFAFTAGVDNLVGTANDDTFNAVVVGSGGAVVAGSGALLTTLQGGDTATGGGGNDTLNITVIDPTGGSGATGIIVVPGATISGIRNIDVHAVSTNSGDTTVVLASNFPGAVNFVDDRSTNVVTFGQSPTVGALSSGQSLGVNGNGAVTMSAAVANYGNSVTSGVINLTNGTGNGTTGPAVELAGNGLTTVTINSSGAANVVSILAADAIANSVTTLNIAANTALTVTAGVIGIGSTTAGATETFNITGSAAVALTTVAAAGNNVTTLNVNANNGSTLNTGNITGLFAAGAVINVSGNSTTATPATASVSLGIIDPAVKTLNASGLTAGGVAATIGANPAIAVTGGAGTDVITVAAGAGASLTGLINGGAGTDIFAVTTAADLVGSLTPLVSGFETLRVSNTGSASLQVYDPTLISGITSYQVGASAGTGGVELINMVAGAAVTVIGNVSAPLVLDLNNAAGTSDAINLTLNNQQTTGTNVSGVTLANLILGGNSAPGQVETLNIVSSGRVAGTGTYNSVNVNSSGVSPNYLDANKVVISGAAGLTYITPPGMTHAQTIDASANTGGVNIVGNLSGPNLLTVLGTGVDDTINVNGTQALVYGGAGGDFINVGGADVQTIAYKASTDSQLDLSGVGGAGGNVGASGTGTANTSKMDIITGFVSGTDKIDVTAFGFTGALAGGIADKGSAASDAQFTSILTTSGLFSDGVNTRAFAEIHGTNTMSSTVAGDFLVIDVNKDGIYEAGTDIVIKLQGLTNLAISDILT